MLYHNKDKRLPHCAMTEILTDCHLGSGHFFFLNIVQDAGNSP